MGKLDGRVSVITGAAMGMGEGIARVHAKHGAHVVLWDISERVFEIAKALDSEGYKASPFKVDVTKLGECQRAAEAVITELGKIDALCANAGTFRLAKLIDMSDEDRDFQFNVNFIGVWNSIKAVLFNMTQNKYGRIVITSSVTGPIVADPTTTAYAASKGALRGLTKALAVEVAEDGITVNAICPGFILTPMSKAGARAFNPENPDDFIRKISSMIPMGRYGDILEVGELAAFLSSDESSYITGAEIVIDGGATLPESKVAWA